MKQIKMVNTNIAKQTRLCLFSLLRNCVNWYFIIIFFHSNLVFQTHSVRLYIFRFHYSFKKYSIQLGVYANLLSFYTMACSIIYVTRIMTKKSHEIKIVTQQWCIKMCSIVYSNVYFHV